VHKLYIDIVVYVGSSTLDEVMRSFEQLNAQSVLPRTITFVLNGSSITPPEIAAKISGFTVPWRISAMEGVLSKDHAIHVAVENLKGNYYGVFEAGEPIPFDYLKKVRDNMPIIAVEPSYCLHGLVVLRILHDALHRGEIYDDSAEGEVTPLTDVDVDIIGKIRHISEVEQNQYLIKKYEDLV
jgi:hypothetical protein